MVIEAGGAGLAVNARKLPALRLEVAKLDGSPGEKRCQGDRAQGNGQERDLKRVEVRQDTLRNGSMPKRIPGRGKGGSREWSRELESVGSPDSAAAMAATMA